MATKKIEESVPVEQVGIAEDAQNVTAKESPAEVGPETQPTEEKVVKKRAPRKPKSVEATEAVAEAAAEVVPQTEAAPAAEQEVAPKPKRPRTRKVVAEPAAEPVKEPTEPKAEPVAPSDDVETPAETTTEGVSFNDEEAALAADAPEFVLENDEISEDNEDEAVGKVADTLADIGSMSKSELVAYFSSLLESKPVQMMRYDVEAIKVAFYRQHRNDVEALRKEFVERGGKSEDFIAPADNDEIRLKEAFSEYRRRREEYMSNLERTKEDNLKIKQKIIEDLKELVNSNETMNQTFQSFRELQQRWKETGVVPQAYVKELWETYNLHVENFYNYIKINKELRDLDLKRNYEAKIQLCEAAEALVLEPSTVVAFRKLQELHEQWREIGPVSNEYKDSIWERFKEASSRINKQHQEYYDTIKEEQKRNLELKTALCVKVEELSTEVLTSRKEWNKASDQLVEIQKVWKTIGFAPKKDNTKIYERFRVACDHFFELKRAFYGNVKAEMTQNLQLKTEICEAVEALQDSEQWKKTTEELIALQKRWKEIGPVSRRYSDAIWKRFRTACDKFFSRKAAHFSGVDAEHDDNLAKKNALIAEIEAYDGNCSFDDIKEFQRRWNEIGFVPIKEKESVQKRYREAVDRLFATLRSSEHGRNMDRYRSKISTLKGGGDRRLKVERDRLYNKVKQLEQDIATLENNIGFFARSKNAEAMIRDVQDKIEHTKAEMAATIEKINLIDKENQDN